MNLLKERVRRMLWREIDSYVQDHHMVDGTDQVIIGLSGGADSVCLARYLLDLKGRGGPDLLAVHVNHLLRGAESYRDQAFVEDFCSRFDLPLLVYEKDIRQESQKNRESLEEAGRRVRYACFRDLIKKDLSKRTRIAVAHHADDLAETMLFRMIRGTGPAGLVGILPVSGDIIRPFLGIGRERVLAILRELGQGYVTDSSNMDLSYSRNHIRHQILPPMLQVNPRAVDHMKSLSDQMNLLLSHVEREMDDLAAQAISQGPEGYELSISRLLGLDDYERSELARRILALACGGGKDIGSVHIKQLLSLARNLEGKENAFPQGVKAEKRGDRLVLYQDRPINLAKPVQKHKIILPEYEPGKSWTLALSKELSIDISYEDLCGQGFTKKDCMECFDYDTIKNDLYIRTRQDGDYFVFDGEGRHKKLSRYFIDQKIPVARRDQVLLLAEGSHVLWIMGARISEAYKVTPATRHMLIVSQCHPN